MGGEAQASDDISELKFFELDELGEVPATPLVRQVLNDVGLLARILRTNPRESNESKDGVPHQCFPKGFAPQR